jgi:threonylcarbamoyladenosine tRNA methylthiotransferase MtaB
MRITFFTLGCKANQYDTQAIKEALEKYGAIEVDEDQPADFYIINTCAVTRNAFNESKKIIRRAFRINPQAKIIVTGCAAVSNKDEIEKIQGVFKIIPHKEKFLIPQIITSNKLPTHIDYHNIFDLTISRFDEHTRAFLKIQDGCDLECSFCIVPRLRGPSVSRKLPDIIDEARRLIDKGYKEIVLTGIHIGSYKTEQADLITLVKQLVKLEGLGRIRLSSLEANEIKDELLELMAQEHKLCPHLHIPLQSGSDRILKLMKRRYNTTQFLQTVEKIWNKIKDCAITTDIIVGFPQETDFDFKKTVEMVKKVGFSRIHIFSYSPREGTESALMKQIPPPVKKTRMTILKNIAQQLMFAFHKKFLGKMVEIIVEDAKDGEYFGYTQHYIYCKISGKVCRGQILKARVSDVEQNRQFVICTTQNYN